MTIPYRAHPPLAVLRALVDKSLITFPGCVGRWARGLSRAGPSQPVLNWETTGKTARTSFPLGIAPGGL